MDQTIAKQLLQITDNCSGYKAGQDILIDVGMTQWILHILQTCNELSHSVLIYLTSTLMNLMARTKGRVIALAPE